MFLLWSGAEYIPRGHLSCNSWIQCIEWSALVNISSSDYRKCATTKSVLIGRTKTRIQNPGCEKQAAYMGYNMLELFWMVLIIIDTRNRRQNPSERLRSAFHSAFHYGTERTKYPLALWEGKRSTGMIVSFGRLSPMTVKSEWTLRYN